MRICNFLIFVLAMLLLQCAAFAGGISLDKAEGFMATLPQYLTVATTVVTAANAVTCMTPTKSDDGIVSVILKVLNFLSFNFGRNRNKDDI